MHNTSLRCSAALLAALCFLPGCSTIGLGATEVVPLNAVDLIAESAKINKALTDNSNVSPSQIAEHGYTTVSNNCDIYFTELIKASNRVKLTNADLTSLGTAAAVISTLTGATPKVIGGTAALFGLASSLTTNYEQYAFATPYPSQTHRLVTKALAAYLLAAPPVANVEQAISIVSGYARLCSYAGINDLAQQAISAAVPEDVNKPTTLFSASDRTQYLNPIDALLSKKPDLKLAETDYVALALMADSSTSQDNFLVLQTTLSDTVDKPTKTATTNTATPPVIDPSKELRSATVFLNALSASNANFAKQVAALKDSLTKDKPAAATSAAAMPDAATPAVVVPLKPFVRPNIQIK